MSQYITGRRGTRQQSFRRGAFGHRYGSSVLGDLAQELGGILDIFTPTPPTTVTAAWSVKAYAKGTGTVWASYQSPGTNTAIIEMQTKLTKLGIPCNTDGLIGTQTVTALRELVRRAAFVPNDRLASGETVGAVVGQIVAAGKAPGATDLSAAAVAQNGATIRAKLFVLAANAWFVTTMKNLGKPGTTTTTPKAPTTPISTPSGTATPYATTPASSPGSGVGPAGAGLEQRLAMMSSSQKMMLGAGALLAGVLVARGGKKGKRSGGKTGGRS